MDSANYDEKQVFNKEDAFICMHCDSEFDIQFNSYVDPNEQLLPDICEDNEKEPN